MKYSAIIIACLAAIACGSPIPSAPLTLSAPDYSSAEMWYSQQQNHNAEVDVFYITPTCIWDWTDSTGVVHNYMDTNNHKQRYKVDGANQLAAALFSTSCRFYSAYYRQISMESWMQSQDEIERRYKVAHSDVVMAFDYYMKHLNKGRPFILAGHSQGGKAVVELLKHTLTEDQHKRMIAAYVFGYEIRKQEIDKYKLLKPAQDSIDCGVVVCYNSVSHKDAASQLLSQNAVCINPINWRRDTTYAKASENLGSVFFGANSTDTLFQRVGAKIDTTIHTLIIDGLSDDDYYMYKIGALFPKGNYHVQEINLYFMNLQKNIAQRISAFTKL